jgi:hypothetical protein
MKNFCGPFLELSHLPDLPDDEGEGEYDGYDGGDGDTVVDRCSVVHHVRECDLNYVKGTLTRTKYFKQAWGGGDGCLRPLI